ncbi:MAG: hypothetical protein U0Q16_26825 [Bryobacteraceae bacterium]
MLPLAAAFCFAQTPESPTGPRITPPTLNSVAPLGVARGMTAELTVEGLNLAGASAIYFTESGIKGRIVRVKELPDLPDIRLGANGTASTVDVGPLPPRNQVTVEVDVAPETPVGPVKFRVLTPLGSSPEGTFLIEPYYGESPDKEPNDTFEGAFETFLPTILAGTISRPGDLDHFKIKVKAGEELVFENQAMLIGSALQPVVRILAEDQTVLAEFGYDGGATAQRFRHRFEKAGTYYIRIADYESTGRGSNFYRILVGRLPVAISAFPLGVKRGAETEVALTGYNLGADKLRVAGKAAATDENAAVIRPKAPDGAAFTELRLALGDDPEVAAAGSNRALASAQGVTLPATINGRVPASSNGVPVEHYFKFNARKGQRVNIEVEARRLGSELDSFVDIVDAKGQPIERLTARAVWDTFVVLRDHDSAGRGIRIQSWNALNVGDYIMIGSEILRVDEVPDGPDEDMLVEGFGGMRKAYFGTSSESHGIDRAVYKVQIHPAGAKFSPNGLPLARVYYRNDDGGPGYGKDSFLDFTAPADGDYFVRLRDVRGLGESRPSDNYGYRLHIREPRPDFRLAANPRNPNVPRGGAIPLTVTALRLEGHDGPIEVSVANLPPGLTATTNTIAPGLDSCTILLSAAADAKLDQAAPLAVTARSMYQGKTVTHTANPGDRTALVSLMVKPDVAVHAETKVVELEPGQTAEVKVRVVRNNGFAGRVPIEVRDLPARVRVTDSGLNGVLVTEDESERSFKLWALPNAEPGEGRVYLSGRIETRSGQQNSYAAVEPVVVRVKAAKRAVAQR